MYRSLLLVSTLGTIGVAAGSAFDAAPLAWPHTVSVTGLDGKNTPFRAITLGGELVFQVGKKSNPKGWFEPPVPVLRTLARGDTLKAVAPANYALDLARGPVVFFTTGADSVRVFVSALRPVAAQGRRLTVRLVADTVVIDSR